MNYATEVDPAIRRLHPELDERQLELIGHLDGPLLGIAGPGLRQNPDDRIEGGKPPAVGRRRISGNAALHLQPRRRPRTAPTVQSGNLGRRLSGRSFPGTHHHASRTLRSPDPSPQSAGWDCDRVST